MAETLTFRQQDKVRDIIKTRRIVEELQRYIEGDRKMEAGQVRACGLLLDRTMPCLSATEITADDVQALPILKIVRAAS